MAVRRGLLRAAAAALRSSGPTGQAVAGTATVLARQQGPSAFASASRLPTYLLAGAAVALGCTGIALAEAAPPDPYAKPTELHGLPREVVLYQYEVCPFCCKVKAFLDYNKIPYRVVEVNPLTKAELKWSEYQKVPVLRLDDSEQLNDSSAILSRLQAELDARGGGGGAPPATPWWRRVAGSLRGVGPPARAGGAVGAGGDEEAGWRRWVDEVFVRLLTVNIYRTAGESWQTFDYITRAGNFNWVERQAARVAGAGLMRYLSTGMVKKYGIEGDVRQRLYEAADAWVDAVGPERPFLGGASPGLADLSVFGVVRAVVGTDTFRDLMMNSKIAPWYDRMVKAVGDSARVEGGAAEGSGG